MTNGHRVRAVPAATVVVTLDEPPYAGLRAVCVASASVGMMLEFQGSPEDGAWLQALEHRCRRFGDEVLLDWNVDDKDGNPRPANVEGMLAIPSDMATALILGWLKAMQEPSGPLGEQSPDGEQSVEQSRPRSRRQS